MRTRKLRARSPSPPVLQVTGLGVSRGGTVILQDVSWRVGCGEHWAILGANGSGKTSLLAALTGYLTPSEGEITVLGRRFGRTDWRELRTRVGLVSSAIRQMMPDLETACDIVLGGRRATIGVWGRVTAADRARATRILKDIECGHLAARPWVYLSQSERQRLLIGRALMARPRLLILDEPCAGLDPAAREHFLQYLQRLGNRPDSPALVLVTHHVEEIMPVLSHVLLLKTGRVLSAGKKLAVLNSRILSQTFKTKVRVTRGGGRYALIVSPKARALV